MRNHLHDGTSELHVENRQRSRRIDRKFLEKVVRSVLADDLGIVRFVLGVYLVDDTEMIELNETHLQHAGTTDVITFDYGEGGKNPDLLAGDLFLCVDEAERQAVKYRATWQEEIARYIVHGILHLLGHDDHGAPARKKMKREENRLLRRLQDRFDLKRIGRLETAKNSKS